MNMKDRIIKIIKEKPGVSFAEMEMEIKGFKGKWALEYTGKGNPLDKRRGAKNIFIWFDVSDEAADALEELMSEQRIMFSSTPLITYLADGVFPNVPQARSMRAYKKPRWMPVVFNKGPKWHE